MLVTGGAGFAGSNLVRHNYCGDRTRGNQSGKSDHAGDLFSHCGCLDDSKHTFVHGDICDARLLAATKPITRTAEDSEVLSAEQMRGGAEGQQ